MKHANTFHEILHKCYNPLYESSMTNFEQSITYVSSLREIWIKPGKWHWH